MIAGNDMGAGARDRDRWSGRSASTARTIFTGLLRGQERLEALADADVVVYPSEDEVFGLVPLEALLCGTPVIVADDSGCGEIVRADRRRPGRRLPATSTRWRGRSRAMLDAPADGARRRGRRRIAIRARFGDDVVCASDRSRCTAKWWRQS